MKGNITGIVTAYLLLVWITFPAYGLYLEDPSKVLPLSKQFVQKISPRYKEGEVLVKFKHGVPSKASRQIASSRSMVVAKEFNVLSKRKGQGYFLLKSDSLKTEELIDLLGQIPEVEVVTPNYTRKICEIFPNDLQFSQLWGLHNTAQGTCDVSGGLSDADIDAPEAWDINTGSPDVVVAVIDTGVDYTHTDLAENIWVNDAEATGIPDVDDDGNGYVDDIYGYDFASDYSGSNDPDPMDIHYHGTHVAGTVGAQGNNSAGVVGVNWQVKIMALKGMRPDEILYDDDVMEAIEYAVTMKSNYGVNVVAINASWGGSDYNELLKDAIETAGAAGIIFVAAAGNDYGNNNDVYPFYPCAYDSENILCVAATDPYDDLALFSNYGSNSVDLAAPGDGILSTVPGYTPGSGDLFFDDLEGGNSNWVHGGINDSWAITEEYSFSPTHAWSDSPGGNYLDFTDSYLALSQDIDLTNTAGINLKLGFWVKMDVEFLLDVLSIEMSGDGGASWQTIESLTGYSESWLVFSFPIPEEYRTSQFRFRFRLMTFFGTSDGVYIDNVGIGSGGGGAYKCLQGTSMAAPHVTGAVALMTAEYPAENLSQRMSRILSGVDVLPSLAGAVKTEGRLDLFNSISGGVQLCSESDTGALDIVGASGNVGETVTYTVSIHNAPNVVDAVGFEVIYDENFLEYAGVYNRGDCVTHFDYFDCSEPVPGVIRCGGFEGGPDIIAEGADCDLVELQFSVLQNNCEPGVCPVTLGLQELVDDLAGWTTSHGCFCWSCACACDVNGDGRCTPQDALCSFQVYLGTCPTGCGDCGDVCCDVNQDENCTPADSLCRFQEYLGIHPNCFD